jgi:CRP-like cAMP-binding protein
MAFRDNAARNASIRAKKDTEFIMLEKSDYEAIMNHVAKSSLDTDTQKELELYAETCPLFASLNIDRKFISKYCEIRKFPPNSTIVAEGETSNTIWFMKTGSCRVVKIVNVLQERYLGKTYSHVLPMKLQEQTLKFSYKDIKPLDLVQRGQVVLNGSPSISKLNIVHKIVEVHRLEAGDYFGDSDGILTSQYDKNTGFLDVEDISEMDDGRLKQMAVGSELIIGRRAPFPVSIISNCRSELIGVSKTDFHQFSTTETWKLLLEKKQHRLCLKNVLDAYEKKTNWEIYCKKEVERLMRETKEKKEQGRHQFEYLYMKKGIIK